MPNKRKGDLPTTVMQESSRNWQRPPSQELTVCTRSIRSFQSEIPDSLINHHLGNSALT